MLVRAIAPVGRRPRAHAARERDPRRGGRAAASRTPAAAASRSPPSPASWPQASRCSSSSPTRSRAPAMLRGVLRAERLGSGWVELAEYGPADADRIASRFHHVVALDPPADAAGGELLAELGSRLHVHLVWGPAEVEFAREVVELRAPLRDALAVVWRADRDGAAPARCRPRPSSDAVPCSARSASSPGRCRRPRRPRGVADLPRRAASRSSDSYAYLSAQAGWASRNSNTPPLTCGYGNGAAQRRSRAARPTSGRAARPDLGVQPERRRRSDRAAFDYSCLHHQRPAAKERRGVHPPSGRRCDDLRRAEARRGDDRRGAAS